VDGIPRDVYRVEAPIPATSVLVDLRNFTPNFNAAEHDPDGTNRFCHFLAEFYGACLRACTIALEPAARADPPLHASSTGDGVLVVFHGPRHFASGLLSAFLLDTSLNRLCERQRASVSAPEVDFGVGIESGEVSRVVASSGQTALETCIGHCINVSARVEALTKVIHDARVVIADSTAEACAAHLYGLTFGELRARDRSAPADADRIAIHNQMHEMNRRLCLTYLDRYTLKGVRQPTPLYRIAPEAAHLGTQRFRELLHGLVWGDPEHLEEVFRFLAPVPQ
jgi:class 3 adenylate cyclase